jgi:GDP-L-fucose synthase
MAALIRRFHEAKESNAASVTCWGTGTPRREFLHVDDLGEACVFALQHWNPDAHDAPRDASGQSLSFLNVGSGMEFTIKELAELVAGAVGYQGTIHWDHAKPDGTPRKLLDVSRLKAMGWRAKIPLAEGLRSTCTNNLVTEMLRTLEYA